MISGSVVLSPTTQIMECRTICVVCILRNNLWLCCYDIHKPQHVNVYELYVWYILAHVICVNENVTQRSSGPKQQFATVCPLYQDCYNAGKAAKTRAPHITALTGLKEEWLTERLFRFLHSVQCCSCVQFIEILTFNCLIFLRSPAPTLGLKNLRNNTMIWSGLTNEYILLALVIPSAASVLPHPQYSDKLHKQHMPTCCGYHQKVSYITPFLNA